MDDGPIQWSNLMDQLPWSDFLKNQLRKPFGPLTTCKPNVHQEEWPCTRRMNMLVSLLYAQKWRVWGKFKFEHFCCSCCCLFLSWSSIPLPPPPQKKKKKKKLLEFYYSIITLPWVLAFFYKSTCFTLPTTKIHWTMLMNDVGLKICLLGTLNSMVDQSNIVSLV